MKLARLAFLAALLFDARAALAQPAREVPRMPEPEPPVEQDSVQERLGPQAKPPGSPPPVPNPSPVVLGGEPTEPGSAAVPLKWDRRRYSGFDLAVTIVGGGTLLASAIIAPQPRHVYGPVLFDEDARDFLRQTTLQKRYTFRDASDVGLSLSVTWPFFVDSLITAWWHRGSRDVAEQMALVGLETFAVVGAVQGVTNVLVSRERPYGDTCGGDQLPADAFDCTGSRRHRSFFSGHAAFSFTGAALVCLQHFEHGLLGPPWDAISCGGAYAVAATTATFRVVADVHYASDIITGAVVGSLIGYGVPLLHFRKKAITPSVKTGGGTFRLVPQGLGAGVVGVF